MSAVSEGRAAEARAAEFLQAQGYVILRRNYAARGGEIDLIAREGDFLCFVEVKSSRGDSLAHGAPRERVTPQKQRRICQTALRYLQREGLGEANIRFDVVEITPRRATLLRGAFAYLA